MLGELKGCGCKVCGAASAKQKADDSVAAELCHRLGSPFYPAALRIPSRLDLEIVWVVGMPGWMPRGERNQETYLLRAPGCMTLVLPLAATQVLAYCEQLSRHQPCSSLYFAAAFQID